MRSSQAGELVEEWMKRELKLEEEWKKEDELKVEEEKEGGEEAREIN